MLIRPLQRKRTIMSKIRYAKEPVDTKLLILYVFKNIRFIVYGVLVFACLFGGIYHLERNVWSDPTPFTAESVIYMTYADDVREGNVYINDFSWPVLIKSDLYINTCLDKLKAKDIAVSRDSLEAMISANIETDLRMVIVKASSLDKSLAIEVNHCLTETIAELVIQTKDIDKADIITLAADAKKIEFSDRTWNMAITGAVVGAVVALIGIIIAFVCDDSVYLPTQFEYRYDIPVLGVLVSKMRKGDEDNKYYFGESDKKTKKSWNKEYLKENYRHILESAKVIATTDLSLSTDTEYVKKALDETVKALVAEERRKLDIEEIKPDKALYTVDDYRVIHMPPINEHAQIVSELREFDAVILLVQAGDHNGSLIERAIGYMEKQDIKVAGALIYDADAFLLSTYTFSPFSKSIKVHKEKNQEK